MQVFFSLIESPYPVSMHRLAGKFCLSFCHSLYSSLTLAFACQLGPLIWCLDAHRLASAGAIDKLREVQSSRPLRHGKTLPPALGFVQREPRQDLDEIPRESHFKHLYWVLGTSSEWDRWSFDGDWS